MNESTNGVYNYSIYIHISIMKLKLDTWYGERRHRKERGDIVDMGEIVGKASLNLYMHGGACVCL